MHSQSSLPEVAASIPADSVYVCPIYLKAFSEYALARKELTREHVPPKSLV